MFVKIFAYGLFIALQQTPFSAARCQLDIKSKWSNRCSLDINCEVIFDENTPADDTLSVKENINNITDIVSNVNGLHICQDYNISDVFIAENFSGLNLTELNISYLKWPQVREINASHNNLRIVKDYTFYDFDLILLDLSFNQIEIIEDKAFGAYSKIEILLLQNNKISTLSNLMCSNLKYIDISHNRIDDLRWLNDDIYSDLETIKADDNRIAELDWRVDHIKGIKQISLVGNIIKFLKQNVFANLQSLEVLDLSMNSIDAIQPEMFSGLNSLYYLNISHNNIDGITAEYFTDSLKLSVLDLSFNNLGFFALFEGRARCPIDYILLNFNNLSKSDIAAIVEFPSKVRHINLDGNKFSCRSLVHKEARELIHNKLYDANNPDDFIEIDCSSGEQQETFIVGPRRLMSRTDRMFVPNFLQEEDFDVIKHTKFNDSTALVEVKFIRQNNEKTANICENSEGTKLHSSAVGWIVALSVIGFLGVTLIGVWTYYPECSMFAIVNYVKFRRLQS